MQRDDARERVPTKKRGFVLTLYFFVRLELGRISIGGIKGRLLCGDQKTAELACIELIPTCKTRRDILKTYCGTSSLSFIQTC